ncbi:MAG: maltose ABC transporter permease MalF [Betaproteobacteria bacterium]|nr:MAG: maltose ABC transporter permease MalF [Betaproteobacteria bacterium]
MSTLTTAKPGVSTDWAQLMKWPLTIALGAAMLYLVFNVYAAGQAMWALGLLTLTCAAFYSYLSNIGFAYRYLFPGLAGMAIFVAFPLLYTMQIGFTNYSSSNLLSFERSSRYLLDQSIPDEATTHSYTVHREGDTLRLALSKADGAGALVTDAFASNFDGANPLRATPQAASQSLGTALSMRDIIANRETLQRVKITLPTGETLNYSGLREFARLTPVWKQNADGSITKTESGESFSPNGKTGFFENAKGDKLQPGYTVGVGFANYSRMINDPDFRAPFFAIFIWTVVFAGLTVVFVTAVGVTLAVLLNWEALRFRTVYRTLLFLPYAVPGFISILVFKGLFNQNFGEINAILDALFGVKPAWFADPLLAKVMLLIVNVWLGFPYIMVLCAGLIKSIPADLYEASAIAGASPLTNFFKITLPLIIKPLSPLLVMVFAFNFNNFVLIALLTDGRPDFLNTKIPAGTNDILVSYTYRIAFKDSGQDFGLAAAISTVMFFMVAAMSIWNLRLASKEINRGSGSGK